MSGRCVESGSVGCGGWRGMEVKIRPCCCSLDTAAIVVGWGMAAIYLILGVLAVGWVVIHYLVVSQTVGFVIEVDSFDEVYVDLGAESGDTLVLGSIAVIISFLGIFSSLSLIVGVLRRSSCFLLPWLVWHLVIILSLFGTGLYLVIHFSLLVDEMDVLKAVASTGPVLAGIFLIFIWVLVDQLFIQIKKTSVATVRKNPIKNSTSALRINHKHQCNTLRNKHGSHSQMNTISINEKMQSTKHQELYFQPKTQSIRLEHILDSASNSSNSTYFTSLPHLATSQDKFSTFRSYKDNSRIHIGKTNTMASSRSITSVKSVSNISQVKDCHFWEHELNMKNLIPDTEGLEDGITIEFSEEEDNNVDAEEKPTDYIPALQPPIYPTMKSNNSLKSKLTKNGKYLTKEKLIDLYCPTSKH